MIRAQERDTNFSEALPNHRLEIVLRDGSQHSPSRGNSALALDSPDDGQEQIIRETA